MKKNSFFAKSYIRNEEKFIFLQNFRSFFIYSEKNKNRRGDQIPPKESSICGEKKDENFIWLQCCMTELLSFKM